MTTLRLLGRFLSYVLVSKEGKEDVVSNLNRVDVQQTLRGGNKGKVDCVGRNPNSPTSHDRSLEVCLELGHVIIPRLALDKVQVSKEHTTKNGVPNGLVDKDLGGNRHGCRSGELGVKESVKEVSRATVNEESKGAHSKGPHRVVGTFLFDKDLRQNVTCSESGERSETLSQEGLRIQQLVVSSPKSRHD